MSFIVHTSDVKDVFTLAQKMIALRGCKDDGKLRQVIEKRAKTDPNSPISFNSVNARTFLLKVGDYIVAQTCNNYSCWSDLDLPFCDMTLELANELVKMGLRDDRQKPTDFVEIMETLHFNIEKLADFWFVEIDIKGRGIDGISYCDKCYGHMFQVSEGVRKGKLICPTCGGGKS